jgi:hypothetical protein
MPFRISNLERTMRWWTRSKSPAPTVQRIERYTFITTQLYKYLHGIVKFAYINSQILHQLNNLTEEYGIVPLLSSEQQIPKQLKEGRQLCTSFLKLLLHLSFANHIPLMYLEIQKSEEYMSTTDCTVILSWLCID